MFPIRERNNSKQLLVNLGIPQVRKILSFSSKAKFVFCNSDNGLLVALSCLVSFRSVAAGKVYNAKDGAAKLGLDAEGVNKEWSKLTRGKDLIKFGGGFYCGKVKDIYVMNGFYMSMRAGKFCFAGKSLPCRV